MAVHPIINTEGMHKNMKFITAIASVDASLVLIALIALKAITKINAPTRMKKMHTAILFQVFLFDAFIVYILSIR